MSIKIGDTFINSEGRVWKCTGAPQDGGWDFTSVNDNVNSIHVEGELSDWQQCWRNVEPAVGQVWQLIGSDSSINLIGPEVETPWVRECLQAEWVCLAPPEEEAVTPYPETAPAPAAPATDVCRWANREPVAELKFLTQAYDTEEGVQRVEAAMKEARKRMALRREWPFCKVTGQTANLRPWYSGDSRLRSVYLECPHCSKVGGQ